MNVSKAQKLHCPLLDKPCIQDECMWWTNYVRQKSEQEQEVVFNCAIGFLPILLGQGIMEQVQTQRQVQHQTNQMAATFVALQRGITIPMLSGNSERDKETIKELQGGEV